MPDWGPTVTDFTPRRSDAIRASLVDLVDAPASHRRRLALGVGTAIAVVLATGGGVAAAAGIWNPGIAAPEGVTPGMGASESLASPVEYVIDGSPVEIPLDPPSGATHVRATLTCTSAGTTGWGLDAAGNNPSSTCTEDDVAPGSRSGAAWMDFRLDGASTFYVQPVDGATSVLTLEFLGVEQTAWGVNDDGETYGTIRPDGQEPTLQLASGRDFEGALVDGYVRTGDLTVQCPGAPMPTTPEQALAQQERCDREYPDGFDIPLYESDGTTQIGWFRVG